MKSFIKLNELIEPVLKKSEALFDEGNKLDLTMSGEDWELEDIFFVLESYVAKESIKRDEFILLSNMNEFVEKVWDALWILSNYSEQDIQNWLDSNENLAFVKMKLEDRNRFKQLCIVKIVNEVAMQISGYNLIAVI